ncbi:MAG: hypothetical protein HYX60_10415 [Legionella longbeachae]|nr:hypothetical protein [Legionella longbeachae]
MPIYYAVKLQDSDMDWNGAVQTKNSFFSIFCQEKTYNIRVRDLTSAFIKTEKFAIFDDEKNALNYLKLHQCFASVAIYAYYTYPIFKVETKNKLYFNDNEFIELTNNNLKPIKGKLLHLDHKCSLPESGPWFDLEKPSKSIIYDAQFTCSK